jgi:hypothetical protein
MLASRGQRKRWLEAMQVLIGDRKFSEPQLARPGRPASARNGPHGCGSAYEDQRPEIRRKRVNVPYVDRSCPPDS